MKISREWLGDYVDLTDLRDDEIAARLTAIGHAVEAIEQHHGHTVFEIEFTTNRVDAMSHLGLARELSAALGRELLTSTYETAGDPFDTGQGTTSVPVEIEAPGMCDRFTAVEIREVAVKPSGNRVRERLEAVGLRPINNIVDATNYVMMAVGHPLHAFDLDKLRGPRIVVRAGRDDERLTTLDGVRRSIGPDTVVVADGDRAVGLGGIMGGLDCEISAATRNVLLECAHFNPTFIRRTARTLGLKTDASYRFERGVDANDTIAAIDQAARLIVASAGGRQLAAVDVVAEPATTKPVRLRTAVLETASAGSVGAAYAVDLFTRLGMSPKTTTDGVEVAVPTYRGDLHEESDLVEEVLRFFGYENVPAALPRVSTGDVQHEPMHAIGEQVRDLLVGCGLSEAVTYSFINPDHNRIFSDEAPILIENALTENVASMRLSILPGLLEAVAFNRNYGTRDGALFEVGKIYRRDSAGIQEKATAAFVLFGAAPSFPGDARRVHDYFDVKGIVEAILERFHVAGSFSPISRAWIRQGQGSEVRSGEHTVATLGVIDSSVLQRFDTKGDVQYAEIDLDALAVSVAAWEMHPVSRYPGVPMVLGLLHAPDLTYRRLHETIQSLAIPHLLEIGLRDRYVPEDSTRVKTTLGMWYQADGRSLTQEEVAGFHERLSTRLTELLPVELLGPDL
ncbi:MAG: phenylalanine--tRNA ligase subunit beta [Acidobacteriota bacterium]